MDVSIIIINYNTIDPLIDCIKSVFEKTGDLEYEIIIVDNSPEKTNGTLSDSFGEKIRIINSPVNLGFGKANNLGASYATGKYLLLLNPDTYLLNNAVKVLANHLDANIDTAVVGGYLYFPDGNQTISYCEQFDYPKNERKAASWTSIFAKKINSKLLTKQSGKHVDNKAPRKVAYVFGADMMIRRDVFEELHGFDPEFFMYAEEQELSWRVHDLGYNIEVVPEARIVHLEGAATKANGRFNARQFRMRMNGKLIYYWKCFGLDGMELFYKYRKLQYQRLIRFAELRGKRLENASLMISILDEEYQKYKKSIIEQ